MESTKSFEEKFARICQVTQTTKDTTLAKILGIKSPSVSAAKKRHQIPTGWVEKIALEYGVSADWIFFGRGPMYLSGEQVNPAVHSPVETPPSRDEGLSCPRCAKLEAELLAEKVERRELSLENRKLNKEMADLLRENGELRVKLARLESVSPEIPKRTEASPPGVVIVDRSGQLDISNDDSGTKRLELHG